ncbi:hypothetical protein ACFYST_26865 [Kitasatospora sp. NPDC004614]|uniref:hypothetical protein n=1 Tax=unclassified Kitasatospora TaxID=2633591 RepID=UPI00369ADCD6
MSLHHPSSRTTAREPHRPAATRPGPGTGPAEQPEAAGGRARLLVLLAALPPALLALARCLDGLGARQMWRDEHASWWAATLKFEDFRALLSNIDAVLAPYYMLLRVWIPVAGDSPAALRVPSAVAMAAAAATVALLGRRLAAGPDRPHDGLAATLIGLGSGVGFALLPTVTRYGQEARPYAFAVFLAALSTLLLLRALERPSVFRWGFYAASVTLIGAAHLVAMLVLGGHLLAVVFHWRRERDRVLTGWAAATAAGVATIAPLILRGNGQSKQIAWINTTSSDLTNLPKELFGSWTTAAVLIALAVIGLYPARRHAPLLLGWILLPPVLTFATASSLHLFLERYLLFTMAPYLLLAAAAVGWALTPLCRGTGGRVGAGVLAVAMTAGLAVLIQPSMAAARSNPVAEPDYRGVADLLAAQAKPGDAMVFNSQLNARRALAYELRSRPAPFDVMLKYYPEDLGKFQGVECDDPSECARYANHVWLVSTAYGPNPFGQMAAPVRAVLEHEFKVVRTQELNKVKLVELERTQPSRSKS